MGRPPEDRLIQDSLTHPLTFKEEWNERYTAYPSPIYHVEIFKETIISKALSTKRECAVWLEYEEAQDDLVTKFSHSHQIHAGPSLPRLVTYACAMSIVFTISVELKKQK